MYTLYYFVCLCILIEQCNYFLVIKMFYDIYDISLAYHEIFLN